MASVLDQAFEIEARVGEGGVGLERRLLEAPLQHRGVVAAAHPLASPAADRFQQHGVAGLVGDAQRLLHAGDDAVRTGDRLESARGERLLRRRLVAHPANRGGRGTDEGQSLLRTPRGEERVLGEEPVPRMHGLAACLLGGLQDRLLVEVGGGGGGGADADPHRRVVEPGGVAVGLRMDHDRLDSEGVASPNDAARDLTPVGDEQTAKHPEESIRRASRSCARDPAGARLEAMSDPAEISRRASEMPASPIRRLAPFAAEAAARGTRVLPLNIGQPDIATPQEMLGRLASFDQANVAYGPSEGLPEFREAVRSYYLRDGLPEIGTDEIFVTTGGSEALLFVLGAVADDGDEVLVFEPFYTNYSGFGRLVGVRSVPVTTRGDDGYHLPPAEEIEAKITPRTRAILLCSPNNPTGTVYSDDEMERIGEICSRHGLFLVSDEVYREFTYDGLRSRSALTLAGLEQQVIVTDSLSKRVSMCGARVGWIVTRNREVLDAVLRMGQARLCPPTLGQHVGAGLADVPESYVREVVAEYQLRRDRVFGDLSEIPGVAVRRPEGAFYLCCGLPVDDAQSFAEFLLKDFSLEGETVMLAPGDGFYATPGLGRNEVRIAYVIDRDRLGRAMRILGAALEAYPGRTPA